MKHIGKMCLGLLMVLAFSQIAYADYAYSAVLIGVSTSKSFSVTLNGQGVVNSATTAPGTATAVIWFNSTTGTTAYVNASVAGASDQVGPYPACTTPILVFKNTGNVVENLNIVLNNTVTGMLFAYNASFAAGSTTGTVNTTINSFNGAGSTFVTGLGVNNGTNVCVWANFSAVGGGTYSTAFNYTSS